MEKVSGKYAPRTLKQTRRLVNKARDFPFNTCPASRHVYMMADALAKGQTYHMLTEEPEHCAGSLYSVLLSLWTARTALARLGYDFDGDIVVHSPAERSVNSLNKSPTGES